jgi:hypothetical protein
VNVYATVGAYQFNRNEKLGCEYYIGLDDACNGIDDTLAKLAIENFGRKRIPSSIGDTMEFRTPICAGSEITGLMTVDIGEMFIPILSLASGFIDFQKIIPLYKAEIDFKRQHGYEALIARMEQSRAEYTDPIRAPVI